MAASDGAVADVDLPAPREGEDEYDGEDKLPDAVVAAVVDAGINTDEEDE